MTKIRIAGSLVAVALMLSVAVAGDSLKSGPQTGDEIPGPFHPLNLTGAKAGEKNCLVCQNGGNPVAMIFAREVSEPLAVLVKKIDAATGEHKDAKVAKPLPLYWVYVTAWATPDGVVQFRDDIYNRDGVAG